MEGRHRIFLLTAAWLAALPGAARCEVPVPLAETDATEHVELAPEPTRRDIDVTAIDTEDFEFVMYGGGMNVEDFGVNPVLGGRFIYHIHEKWFAEIGIGQTDTGETSYETLSGGARLLTSAERRFRFLDLNLSYTLLPGESFIAGRAFNTALYFKGGAGIVEFAGSRYHAINLGLGYRLLPLDWLSVHAVIEDRALVSDLLGREKTTHNLGATLGLGIFF